MLEVKELQRVLESVEQNGNPGLSMLRLKADTGLYGTELTKTLQRNPDIFKLTENGQLVQINREAEHAGNHEAILHLYATRQAGKKRMVVLIVLIVAVVLIAGNGINYVISKKMGMVPESEPQVEQVVPEP
jgi:hypothetical protein